MIRYRTNFFVGICKLFDQFGTTRVYVCVPSIILSTASLTQPKHKILSFMQYGVCSMKSLVFLYVNNRARLIKQMLTVEWLARFTPFSLSRDTALISREDWKIYDSLLVQQDACCGPYKGVASNKPITISSISRVTFMQKCTIFINA